MSEINYEAVLNNNKCPPNVRYAIIRTAVVEKLKCRAERREILFKVGHHLGGTYCKGNPNYWDFGNGRRAKFQ